MPARTGGPTVLTREEVLRQRRQMRRRIMDVVNERRLLLQIQEEAESKAR
jgi:hypothetical protein